MSGELGERELARKILQRIGAWAAGRKREGKGSMTLGLTFCGGCNPSIDRGLLAGLVLQGLPENIRPVPEGKADLLLIINGCQTGCADQRGDRACLIVQGREIVPITALEGGPGKVQMAGQWSER
ncbi:MAG: hypothetical protein HY697_02970 [Deltaproteobacteria bacterium]|nr:hypothetical protein [Deltaproteobacteria bacterium]